MSPNMVIRKKILDLLFKEGGKTVGEIARQIGFRPSVVKETIRELELVGEVWRKSSSTNRWFSTAATLPPKRLDDLKHLLGKELFDLDKAIATKPDWWDPFVREIHACIELGLTPDEIWARFKKFGFGVSHEVS